MPKDRIYVLKSCQFHLYIQHICKTRLKTQARLQLTLNSVTDKKLFSPFCLSSHLILVCLLH